MLLVACHLLKNIINIFCDYDLYTVRKKNCKTEKNVIYCTTLSFKINYAGIDYKDR